MLKLCAALLIAATSVLAQPIPPAPMETVWEGMYAPPYLQNPQIGMTIDCTSSDLCFIGGASNGAGAGVFKYDGEMNGKLTEMPMPNQSMMVMDIKVGGTTTNPTGVFTSVDMFVTLSKGIQYLANNGKEWLASLMPLEFIWESQSLSKYSDSRTYIALGAGLTNNIMMSNDGGQAFGQEALNLPNTHGGYAHCEYPNFMSTPSPQVWFLTWGAEPAKKRNGGSSSSASSSFGAADADATSSFDDVDAKYYDTSSEVIVAKKHMGRTLVISNLRTKKVRVHTKTVKQFYADKKEQQLRADPVCNNYNGSIFTSTDQGKTWTNIYTNPSFMPAEITCFDNTHCTVVAYNADYTATIVTTDGKTWQTTYQTPLPTQVSAEMVQAVGYASQSEVWVGGSKESQEAANGMFWSSNNSGATFTPYSHYVPDVEAVTAMVFTPDGTGFAMGLTMFKTTQIMRYKKQADYGLFIQSHCPIAGCKFLCQNISFPQGMCLNAQGGSAKAFCTENGVEQYNYQTTSCVGSYTKNVQPINQCLNGTNTFFENYCPGGSGFDASRARKANSKDIFRH